MRGHSITLSLVTINIDITFYSSVHTNYSYYSSFQQWFFFEETSFVRPSLIELKWGETRPVPTE